MSKSHPTILTIAGFDPSSGAGITADLKTIAAHDCYGIACITALTVQSTRGVKRVLPLGPDLVRETLEELAADFTIRAVHVGMLATRAVVGTVADFLEERKLSHIVLDPVLHSSSGAPLLERHGTPLLKERMLALAEVVTPNLEEAAALTGLHVTNLEQMREAAEKLHEMGAKAVVITGGHLDPAVDLLSVDTSDGIRQKGFRAAQQKSTSTHGTGCAFATAMACQLARGKSLAAAAGSAKQYVTAAIANAYRVGQGIGPLHHFYGYSGDKRRTTR